MVGVRAGKPTFLYERWDIGWFSGPDPNSSWPCGSLTLQHTDLRSFISQHSEEDAKSIFWLDNIGLKYAHFDDFQMLLQKVGRGSMIKITLDASFNRVFGGNDEVKKKTAEFREQYSAILPDSQFVVPIGAYEFATLLQKMLRIAAEQALPASGKIVYQPVSSFFYQDGAPMLTATGVVCFIDDIPSVRKGWGQGRKTNQTLR